MSLVCEHPKLIKSGKMTRMKRDCDKSRTERELNQDKSVPKPGLGLLCSSTAPASPHTMSCTSITVRDEVNAHEFLVPLLETVLT